MVPRPTSPTSLLWAHQLKKEHSLLLDRVKAVESSTSEGLEIVKELESKTQPLVELGEAIEDVRAQVTSLVSKVSSHEERLQVVDRVRQDIDALKSEVSESKRRQQETETEAIESKSLLRELVGRVEALEISGRAREPSIDTISQTDLTSDVEALVRRLDVVEAKRSEDLLRTKAIIDRLEEVERANVQLKASKIGLQNEVLRLQYLHHRDRAMMTPSEATTAALSAQGTPSSQLPCSPLVEKKARLIASRKDAPGLATLACKIGTVNAKLASIAKPQGVPTMNGAELEAKTSVPSQIPVSSLAVKAPIVGKERVLPLNMKGPTVQTRSQAKVAVAGAGRNAAHVALATAKYKQASSTMAPPNATMERPAKRKRREIPQPTELSSE